MVGLHTLCVANFRAKIGRLAAGVHSEEYLLDDRGRPQISAKCDILRHFKLNRLNLAEVLGWSIDQ